MSEIRPKAQWSFASFSKEGLDQMAQALRKAKEIAKEKEPKKKNS